MAQITRPPAEIQKDAKLYCEWALRENTIEALEEYLRLFPMGPTACRTLALEALRQFVPPRQPDTLTDVRHVAIHVVWSRTPTKRGRFDSYPGAVD